MVHKAVVLIGGVNVNQHSADLGHGLQIYRGIVDVASSGGLSDNPAQSYNIGIFQFHIQLLYKLAEFRLSSGIESYFSGDFAFGAPLADEGFIGSHSEEQCNGTEEDGFSCAGFSGNNIESGGEFDLGRLHQSQITDFKIIQHINKIVHRAAVFK